MNFFDAHNHLQDLRLASLRNEMLELYRSGNYLAVVNASSEADWQNVQTICDSEPNLLPAYGYHPWYVSEASAGWKTSLHKFLENPRASVGEIGLDRWIKNPDLELQREMFTYQLQLAIELDRPASIHCLKAWGPLYDILRAGPKARSGFLLHSFGGPAELIKPFVKLGAYFSFPGYFLAEKKESKRELFRSLPKERLLIETDAPDQLLPAELDTFSLVDPATEKRINHPGNICSVYLGLARYLDLEVEVLAAQVESNFRELFRSVLN